MQSNQIILEVEFTNLNLNARKLSLHPQKVNCAKFIGRMLFKGILFEQVVAVCAHNQITLHSFVPKKQCNEIKGIFVDNIEENILCIDSCNERIAFAGALGICYIYDISKDSMIQLKGHFKQIRCLVIKGKFCLTASDDFTVRMWEITKGVQCFIFLDLKMPSVEVISLSWRFDEQEFCTLDLNQSVKLWSLETEEHK